LSRSATGRVIDFAKMKTPETIENIQNWALEEFTGVHTGGGESQQILLDWFPRLREEVDPATDSVRYRRLVRDAVSVLEQLREAIGGVFWIDDISAFRAGSEPQTRYELWAWPTVAKIEEWANRGTGRAGLDDLDKALADYLKRPWLQHDAIDVSAINALLVTELAELVEDVKSGAALGKPNWSYALSCGNVFAQIGIALAGKLIGFLGAWIIPPGLAVGFLVYSHETAAIVTIIFWGLYVLYRIASIPIRWRAHKVRQKVAEQVVNRVAALGAAWQAACGRTINPSRLKELVLKAEECGQTFPSVLHTLVDRAISRDATALIRTQEPLLDW